MCARRFLFVIFILTLLVVAGAFAIFQFGGNVLIKQAVPEGHFKAPPTRSGPDYANVSSWVAHPDLPSDRNIALWLPDGARPSSSGTRPAALFYIHPTTYLQRDRWNAPLELSGDTAFQTRLIVQSQVSAFNETARIWAPRYRQAAFGAFLLDSKDAQQALDLAYGDVASAFDQFLKANPEGPIILAGHSQGGLHLERLLAEKVAGKPIAKRIVAAYVVGWPISTTSDLPKLGLPGCTNPDQPGCILSWMSFSDPANPDLIFRTWEKGKGLNGGDRRQRDLLCVNPISGTQNGSAGPEANPGTLVPSSDFRSAKLIERAVGAECRKGLLMIGGDIPTYVPPPLPGNNFHVYDYALFWGAIQRDAERRMAAWRQ